MMTFGSWCRGLRPRAKKPEMWGHGPVLCTHDTSARSVIGTQNGYLARV